MSITVKQIAELAGVSRGTVDRVLHNRGRVDPVIYNRVQKIAQEYEFKPNVIAKALKLSNKQLRFGVIYTRFNEPFWDIIAKGFNDAEKYYRVYGVELVQVAMRRITAQEQLRCLRELCECDNPVDGVFLAAMNDPSIMEYINALPDSIPVITYNNDISNCKRLCFIGQNLYDAGRTAARLLSVLISKQGSIVSFTGMLQTMAHQNRYYGMRDTLSRIKPELEIREPILHLESEEVAYDIAKEVLRDTGICGVYITGEGPAGVAQALWETGRAEEVKMVCYDYLPYMKESMMNGTIDFAIGQEPYLQGYLPVKIMYEYKAFNKKPIMSEIFTAIDIRVPENLLYISAEYIVNKASF